MCILHAVSRDGRKLDFAKRKQAYMPITEAEAYVLAVVREKWGQTVSIVMSNDLEVAYEPVTRGC